MAESLVWHYELVSWDRILDIGCDRAFLLYGDWTGWKKHKYVVVESYRTEEEKANYYTGNQHVNRFTPRKNESSGLQNAIILVIIH